MKVYAVIRNYGYEGFRPPYAIFQNKEQAQQFVAAFICSGECSPEIYEYELGEIYRDKEPMKQPKEKE